MKLQVMKELIDEMLRNGTIEPSCSAWASPVILIPKKTGGLAGAAVFSSLDLNSGYWQIEMDSMVQEITAFVCPFGLFQFRVMPFGLKNAPLLTHMGTALL